VQRRARGHHAGLQYATDDKDDRFTVAFTDVEQFQVDYTEKNLKVKVRKGKQYNFTDPDGNADRLFVFHRDVGQGPAAARERRPAPRVTSVETLARRGRVCPQSHRHLRFGRRWPLRPA
jgi:hypothetical protein